MLKQLTSEDIERIAKENAEMSDTEIKSCNDMIDNQIKSEKEEECQIRIQKYIQNPSVPEIHQQYN